MKLIGNIEPTSRFRRFLTKNKYSIMVETYGYYLMDVEIFYFSSLVEAEAFRRELINIYMSSRYEP